MGTFNTGIFGDGTACDVQREFLALLGSGRDAGSATRELLGSWADAIQDVDDGPVFWIALAATQWDYGCLTPEVKVRAVEIIDSGADLRRWEFPFIERRRAVLERLKKKLLSAQPKPRRPRKQKEVVPVPTFEAPSPDGNGKAVAFSLPGADFMQVVVERDVGGSRGGGSVFVANCKFSDVELHWMDPLTLQITYPRGTTVRQKSDSNFYRGEIVKIEYRTKAP